jgi:hypothetical protein
MDNAKKAAPEVQIQGRTKLAAKSVFEPSENPYQPVSKRAERLLRTRNLL